MVKGQGGDRLSGFIVNTYRFMAVGYGHPVVYMSVDCNTCLGKRISEILSFYLKYPPVPSYTVGIIYGSFFLYSIDFVVSFAELRFLLNSLLSHFSRHKSIAFISTCLRIIMFVVLNDIQSSSDTQADRITKAKGFCVCWSV